MNTHLEKQKTHFGILLTRESSWRVFSHLCPIQMWSKSKFHSQLSTDVSWEKTRRKRGAAGVWSESSSADRDCWGNTFCLSGKHECWLCLTSIHRNCTNFTHLHFVVLSVGDSDIQCEYSLRNCYPFNPNGWEIFLHLEIAWVSTSWLLCFITLREWRFLLFYKHDRTMPLPDNSIQNNISFKFLKWHKT